MTNCALQWTACILAASAGIVAVNAYAEGPYGEVRFGVADIDPQMATGVSGAFPGSSAEAELTFAQGTGFGLEAGMREVLGTPLRASVNMDTFRYEFESAELVTAVGADGEPPVLATVNRDQVIASNLNFDARILLVSANVYYEVELGDFKGYLGGGYGQAFIGDADGEFGPLGHVGMTYEMEPFGEVGLRITRFASGGPTHTATDAQFEAFSFNAVTISLGMDF